MGLPSWERVWVSRGEGGGMPKLSEETREKEREERDRDGGSAHTRKV